MTSRMRITTITFVTVISGDWENTVKQNLWNAVQVHKLLIVVTGQFTPKMKIILSFTHHNIRPNLYDFLYFVGHKQFLELCLFVCLLWPHWLSLYGQKCFQNNFKVLCRWKKFIWVWNNMRVSIFIFILGGTIPLRSYYSVILNNVLSWIKPVNLDVST